MSISGFFASSFFNARNSFRLYLAAGVSSALVPPPDGLVLLLGSMLQRSVRSSRKSAVERRSANRRVSLPKAINEVLWHSRFETRSHWPDLVPRC